MKNTKNLFLCFFLLLFASSCSEKQTTTRYALSLEKEAYEVSYEGALLQIPVSGNAPSYTIEYSSESAEWFSFEAGTETKPSEGNLLIQILPQEERAIRRISLSIYPKGESVPVLLTLIQYPKPLLVPELETGWDIYDGGNYRYGPSFIINDDGSIDAWFAAPGARFGADQPFYAEGEKTDYYFSEGEVAQRISFSDPFWRIGVIGINGGGNPCGFTLSLYAWNQDYATTCAQSPLASQKFGNYADGARLFLTNEELFSAGEYLLVVSDPKNATTGLYHYAAAISPTISYRDGAEIAGAFSAFYVGKKSSYAYYWDQASYKRSVDGGKNWSPEVMTLIPTEYASDQLSICDPAVVCFGGYYYAGYTSTQDSRGVCNHLYMARSKNPNGPWEKWNGSGWSNGEDVQPILTYTGHPDCWGVGEPSMVVLDETLYLYYTWNGQGDEATTTRLATASIENSDWPAHLTQHGTVINKTQILSSDHCDVKYREDLGKFMAVHTAGRFATGSYLVFWVSDDGKNFTKAGELHPADGLQEKIHNCGWSGDRQGHIQRGSQQYIAYAYGENWGVWNTHFHPIRLW